MPKSRFPLRKLVVFILVGLGVMALLTALVLHINSTSKSEPVTYEPVDYEFTELEKERDLSAKNFHLRYQSTLDTVSDISGGDKTALEVYRLSSSNLESRRRMVITIRTLPPDGYAGESSYLLRKKDTDKYNERSINLEGNEFIIFEEVNGNEHTAFTRTNGKFAMLAYTMSVADADPKAEFEALLSGFNWIN